MNQGRLNQARMGLSGQNLRRGVAGSLDGHGLLIPGVCESLVRREYGTGWAPEMDLAGAGALQFSRQCPGSSTGGGDIVDNGDAGIVEFCVLPARICREGVVHIGGPCGDIELLLAGCDARASNNTQPHWQLQAIAEMGCEQRALVVTAVPLTAPVQRNGHQQIRHGLRRLVVVVIEHRIAQQFRKHPGGNCAVSVFLLLHQRGRAGGIGEWRDYFCDRRKAWCSRATRTGGR